MSSKLKKALLALNSSLASRHHDAIEKGLFKLGDEVVDDSVSVRVFNQRFSLHWGDIEIYPSGECWVMSDSDGNDAFIEQVNETLQKSDSCSLCAVLRIMADKLMTAGFPPAVGTVIQDLLEGDGNLPSSSPQPAGRGGTCVDEEMRDADEQHDDEDIAYDDEYDDQQGYDLEEEGEVAKTEQKYHKKIKWKQAEEFRMSKKQKHNIDQFAKRQIFTSQEAFQILSNELLRIQEQSLRWNADAIEDSVYNWRVVLPREAFAAESTISQDLKTLSDQGFDGAIIFELHFKDDLHPFYPPQLIYVRPRLRFIDPRVSPNVSMFDSLTCHPLITLRGWNPTVQASEIIEFFLRFIQSYAAVDFSAHDNLDAAYHPIERHLAQIALLCDLAPSTSHTLTLSAKIQDTGPCVKKALSALQGGEVPAVVRKPPSSSAKNTDGGSFFAKGVGYSSAGDSRGDKGNATSWDAAATQAAQAAQDQDICDHVIALNGILSEVDAHARASTPTSSSAHRQDKSQQAERILTQANAWLATSCLGHFFSRTLMTSFTNMLDRLPFYKAVIALLKTVHSRASDGGSTMGCFRDTATQTLTRLLELQKEAELYIKAVTNLQGGPSRISPQPSSSAAAAAAGGPSAEDITEAKSFANDVVTLMPAIIAHLKGATGTRIHAVNGEDDEGERYKTRLADKMLDQSPSVRTGHAHLTCQQSEKACPPARTARIAKELAGLPSLLVLSKDGSIFVRSDEQSSQLWRALITGPTETPYDSGVFLFDIYFPPEYPTIPPKVSFRSTGGGKWRANPNLYNCGKVCLSLLGTWSGGAGEGWDPAVSTAYQVLLSIHSLILVKEPYYNEPGYERQANTEAGRNASRGYSMGVREGTIEWAMLDMMNSKAFPEFRDVIREHFKLRRWVAG